MTDDTATSVDISDDLDTFSDEFYGKKEPEVKEVNDTEDDALATDEDTDAPAEAGDDDATEEDSDGSDSDSDPDEDGSDEDKTKSKGKQRKSAQERINEITKKAREAERANAALLQRLEALETRERDRSKNEEPIKESLPQGAPRPDALDDKGEPIYPLGEFDPNFITDLVKYSSEQEKNKIREEIAREAQAAKIAEQQEALRNDWNNRLDQAEEEVPEIREHITELVDTFQSIEPAYGEYLATVIMQCENGPMIMEYLSQNIGEAQKIVASGPMAATLAIGKLETRLSKVPSEEKRNKKVSDAPPVPETVTKGRKGHPTVRPDTDNLDAFSELFFQKKR